MHASACLFLFNLNNLPLSSSLGFAFEVLINLTRINSPHNGFLAKLSTGNPCKEESANKKQILLLNGRELSRHCPLSLLVTKPANYLIIINLILIKKYLKLKNASWISIIYSMNISKLSMNHKI